MSDQMNDKNNGNNTNNDDKFAAALEFCRKNIRIIAGGVIVLILVAALIFFSGKDKNQDVESTESVPAPTESMVEDVTEEVQTGKYEKDKYPEINELIKKYYKAYAKGDTKKIAKMADPLSDAEKGYIEVFSNYVEKCKNISCYTKKGLDDNSLIVSVYVEMKFKDIETTAPGLERFYVKKTEDGSWYIDNLYGQFNLKRKEFDVDEEIKALLDEFSQQEDVVALTEETQKKYEKALSSDENLKTLMETTIPDAITVWAYDQELAARKAEEEKKAAEEAEKKAAEEEAAKKAEEEKRAAELASAVTVYAKEKVNVRSDASETSEVLGQLEAGAQTTRLEERDDGWSRVDYNNGTQGYVKSEYLSTDKPAQEAPAPSEDESASTNNANGFGEGTVITAKESLNLRQSMSETSDKLATIFAGEKVTVIMSYAEGWTKVTYGDKTGFIKTDLL